LVDGAREINPDMHVLADGVQDALQAPIDVEDRGIDGCILGPYEVFCVKGIGFAYLYGRLVTVPRWALRS